MILYHVYTDGACSGNPGPGGWGALILDDKQNQLVELSGFEPATTNNRMEIQAAIAGIEQVKQIEPKPHIVLYSDSAYLVHAYTKGWMDTWLKTGWKKGTVKNQDLWQRLNALLHGIKIDWVKVKGHADNVYNNRCDRLAVGEVERNASKTGRKPPGKSSAKAVPELKPASSSAGIAPGFVYETTVDPVSLNNPSSDKPSENRCLVSLTEVGTNAARIRQVADKFGDQVRNSFAPVTLSSITASVAQATFNHPTRPVHPYFLQAGDMADFWLARNARRPKPYPAPERSDLIKLICKFIVNTGLPKSHKLGLENPLRDDMHS